MFKRKNKIAILIMTLLLILSLAPISNAETRTEIEKPNKIQRDLWTEDEVIVNGWDTGLAYKTLDDVGDQIDRKGNEVVNFLIRASSPIMLISFIIGIFIIIIGGRKRGIGVGMVICSAVGSVAILYSPEIMYFIQNWMVN